MDIKEIIKWFIPCFHILLSIFVKMDTKLTFIFLILFFNSCPSFGANVDSGSESRDAKNLDFFRTKLNLSVVDQKYEERSLEDATEGRTFGRPFKKMMAGLLPVIFQVGAASTWAIVAALVGVKTLVVTLAILKILLIAGALKLGALFASKGHHQPHGWEPPHHPQKEIHLHIHNGQHESHVEHHPPVTWSRNEVDIGTKPIIVDPYSGQIGGPQTISTPYGNYVKID